jgi:3-oxoacyl-[acyl-carrier protein] reductase
MRFKGKVAVITGGAQGIGKATAEGLAGEGASVIIADSNLKEAHETKKQLIGAFQGRVSVFETDVKKRDDVYDLVNSVSREFGEIDILFNSAGICSRTEIEDISEDEWNEMININLRGVFFCCQAVMPVMKKQRRGRILNMASLAGKVGGIAVGAHYSASKAGVICLTKTFAKSLGPYGVTVNALAPGPVETAMIRHWPQDVKENMIKQAPLGRIAGTQDVAEAALFLLSEGAKHITGETLDINAGLLMD